MSQAEISALKIRDLAVSVVMAHGAEAKGADRLHLKLPAAPDLHTYSDQRLRIAYDTGMPHAIDIYKIGDREVRTFGAIWNPEGDCVVVLHRCGSWEQYLQRLAKGIQAGASGPQSVTG
jgi:hypothetical protein